MVDLHPFHDPLSGRQVVLVLGADPESTGVEHAGCDRLADVTPELDSAFCPDCHWQARISGAWFMDLWTAQFDGSTDSQQEPEGRDHPAPAVTPGETAAGLDRGGASSREAGPDEGSTTMGGRVAPGDPTAAQSDGTTDA